uniref:Uncharacterized protein n=1 Tax=Anguilla anguilla TaxID=7936 RepID=A0A0E9R320_ANGAN
MTIWRFLAIAQVLLFFGVPKLILQQLTCLKAL